MLLKQIALVSESEMVHHGDLSIVSAALQKQASRDLAQFWDVTATVDAFACLEDVPAGYWNIIIKDNIEHPGAAGIHLDKNGQPFALVTAKPNRDDWSLTASHEMIEMLVDPFGNRVMPCDSPKPDQSRVEILVEACDPSESPEFAYTSNGVLVSDFYTVRYFDPVVAPGVRYSFTGAIRAPRQVLRGGYLSWRDVSTDLWWQETWFEGDGPAFRPLGHLSAANGSLRSQVDRLTAPLSSGANTAARLTARAAGISAADSAAVGVAKAASLRQQIARLTGATPESQPPAEATSASTRRSSNGASRSIRQAPSAMDQDQARFH